MTRFIVEYPNLFLLAVMLAPIAVVGVLVGLGAGLNRLVDRIIGDHPEDETDGPDQ